MQELAYAVISHHRRAFGALTLIGAAFSVAPAAPPRSQRGTVQTAPRPMATSSSRPVLRPAPHYRGHRGYYGRPVYRPRCFFTNRRVWTGYGWVVRPVRVCR